MFSNNKILFQVIGSGQNNTIFPPTCPKLMKIAQKLALNKVWMTYLEFQIYTWHISKEAIERGGAVDKMTFYSFEAGILTKK